MGDGVATAIARHQSGIGGRFAATFAPPLAIAPTSLRHGDPEERVSVQEVGSVLCQRPTAAGRAQSEGPGVLPGDDQRHQVVHLPADRGSGEGRAPQSGARIHESIFPAQFRASELLLAESVLAEGGRGADRLPADTDVVVLQCDGGGDGEWPSAGRAVPAAADQRGILPSEAPFHEQLRRGPSASPSSADAARHDADRGRLFVHQVREDVLHAARPGGAREAVAQREAAVRLRIVQ